MKISPIYNNLKNTYSIYKSQTRKNFYTPLKQDTISFSARSPYIWATEDTPVKNLMRTPEFRDAYRAYMKGDSMPLFEFFDIETKRNEDGDLIISHYHQPKRMGKTYSDFMIDEEKLLKDVVEIEFEGDFRESTAVSINKLKKIGRDADFNRAKTQELKNLEYIGGNANFFDSEISNLEKLKIINGDAVFVWSKNVNLNSLEEIRGHAFFTNSGVSELPKLKTIGGRAHFTNSDIRNLKSLKSIGSCAYFENVYYLNFRPRDKFYRPRGDEPKYFMHNKIKIGGHLHT